jgi:hypothetical protein
MKLESDKLAELAMQVAMEKFGKNSFERRSLMNATEAEVRRLGLWTNDDDLLSGSVDPKSKGLAAIDYRISDLAKAKHLSSVRRGVWKLANPKT